MVAITAISKEASTQQKIYCTVKNLNLPILGYNEYNVLDHSDTTVVNYIYKLHCSIVA